MVANGDFENGFTNWSVIGNADATEGSASIDNGFSENGSNPAPDNVLENFLSLAPGTLDNTASPFNATTGSAIESSAFEVTAGQIVAFDWEFTTGESPGNTTFNDFSFVSIDSLSDSETAEADLLADTNGPTGPQSSTVNFSTDGFYQIGFGVVNQGDTAVSSELLLDNIRILNTGFETGDFIDWGVVGNATVQTTFTDPVNAIDIFPTEGQFQAVLSTEVGTDTVPVTDADIEAELGLFTGTLDFLGNGDATEGSAIELVPIDAEVGETLSFDWEFLTGEGFGSTFNDFAFVSITDENGNTLFVDTLESASLGTTPGYETFSYTFDTSGTFTVSVGVVDVQDTAVESTLLVDNLLLV